MAGRSVGDPKEPVPRYAWSLDVTTETWSDRELRHGQAEREYAQARGFVTDPARVCSPQDHAWSGWCDTCAATSLPARSSSIWPTRRTAPRFGAGIRPVSACTAPSTPPGRGVRPVRSVAAVARARGALSGADLCAGLYRPRVIKRGTVNLSNPRAIFAGFASAVHQAACDL